MALLWHIVMAFIVILSNRHDRQSNACHGEPAGLATQRLVVPNSGNILLFHLHYTYRPTLFTARIPCSPVREVASSHTDGEFESLQASMVRILEP